MNRYLRCYAEISLEAIGHNIREVKKRLPEGVKLLGVVKANAYGHGAVPVASYLENQVDYFATATIEEAVELRENGISAPILILGYVDAAATCPRPSTATLWNTTSLRRSTATHRHLPSKKRQHARTGKQKHTSRSIPA